MTTENNNQVKYPITLNHFISLAGIASRRKCAQLIKEHLVAVNGKIVTAPGFRVTEADTVTVEEEQVIIGKRYYIMLNKPPGYSCTASDPYAKLKAVDLIDLANVRLFSAGRLDKESEGLIIFSNDGDYINRLTHPRYGVLKCYEVTTDRPLTEQQLLNFRNGIEDAGEQLKAVDFSCISLYRYRVILNAGKIHCFELLAGIFNAIAEIQ